MPHLVVVHAGEHGIHHELVVLGDLRTQLASKVLLAPVGVRLAPPDSTALAADALLLPRPPIRYLLSEMKKPPWWTAVGRIYRHAYLNCSSI